MRRHFWLAAINAILVGAAPLNGAIVYVDDNAPGDPGAGDPAVSDPLENGSVDHPFDSIQQAIDAVTTGSTIQVLTGTYRGTGNHDIDYKGKVITLQSMSGAELTVIDCQKLGRGFYFHNSEPATAVLDGFTIANGSMAALGGGIRIAPGSPTVKNCIIRENASTNNVGGGVFVDEGSPVLTNCVFLNNTAYENGAGMGSNTGGTVTLNGCTFRGNVAQGNGGGFYCSRGSAILTDCMFDHNVGSGGGVWTGGAQFTMTHCTFFRNRGSTGGAFTASSYGNALVSGCTFIENRALHSGGGLYLAYSGPKRVVNCLVANNVARVRGGGVYVDSAGATLTNCTIVDNSADISGGAVAFSQSSPGSVTNCILRGNSARAGDQLSLDGTSGLPTSVSLAYNNVHNLAQSAAVGAYSTITWGSGNFDADARFGFSRDYHLLPGSPCMDVATATPSDGLATTDLDGNGRALDAAGAAGGQPDIGAYEYNAARPTIAASTRIVDWSWPEAGPVASATKLQLRNCGGGTLAWAIAGMPSWCSLTPASGSSNGEENEITLNLIPDGLAHGTYSATLLVSAPQASNTVSIPLTLNVTRTLRVPSGYATIQAGIDAATAPGDVVLVAPGTYIGPGNRGLDLHGRAITVKSEAGSQQTVLDCASSGRGFYCHSGETTLTTIDGFTIANGYAYEAGGIYIYHASATVRNCVVKNCRISGSNSYGGGIAAYYGESVFEGCTIEGNVAPMFGGGLYISGNGSIIEGCTIRGNSGRSGGGVYLTGGSGEVRRCVITGNAATTGIGGGLLVAGKMLVTNTILQHNSANQGGGAYSGEAAFVNCTFNANRATMGGGIYGEGSSILRNCVLWEDTATIGPELAVVGSYGYLANINIAFSDVRGSQAAVSVGVNASLTWGSGNIDASPSFSFPDDYHLVSGSPCIDAGNVNVPGGLPLTDLDGLTRMLDSDGDGVAAPDIGAYERSADTSTIALSSTVLDFYVPIDTDPTAQILSIRNVGGGVLNWTLAGIAPALAAVPVSGATTTGTDQVALSVVRSGTTYGHTTQRLAVSDAAATNSPRTVQVNLHVNAVLRVPSQYATIQAAIDAATVDGDVILIADGTYAGTGNTNVVFHGIAVTVKSEHGADFTTLDANHSGRAFTFSSGETPAYVLDGLTMINGSTDYGAAVSCGAASPTITRCKFVNNETYYGGGAISLGTNSTAVVSDCSFVGNKAQGYGDQEGGAIRLYGANATISGCTFQNNVAGARGGGVYASGGAPVVRNCTFSGNSGGTGGAIYWFAAGSVENCTFNANIASYYGGGVSLSSFTTAGLSNCVFEGNWAGSRGGGFSCGAGSCNVVACTIRNNTAVANGGGISLESASARVERCNIVGNRAQQAGGGGVYSSGTPVLLNCVVSDNRSLTSGGAIVTANSGLRITNCTVSRNRSASGIGGIFVTGTSVPQITNSIFWDDMGQEIGGAPLVSYSDIKGGWTGIGNIDAPPFAFSDDLQLHASSPCVESASGTPAGGLAAVDMNGNVRVVDANGDGAAIPDMGAYEFDPSRPLLAFSPHSISLFISEGATTPQQLSFSIRNAGGGSLAWGVQEACNWLSLTNESGVATSTPVDAGLQIYPAGLAHGVHTANLRVIDTASGGFCDVPVTLYVTRTFAVPGDYATIQAALDAVITAGDTILLAPGTYQGVGNRDLDPRGKTPSIVGQAGASATIIDCQHAGRGFNLHSGETTSLQVKGITIMNGIAAPGGAVYSYDSGATFTNCTFSRNRSTAETAGAVHAELSNLILQKCRFLGNSVDTQFKGQGGAVYGRYSSAIALDCVFSGNAAIDTGSASDYGNGGACCFYSSVSDLQRCLFNGNYADDQGGAIHSGSGEGQVLNCTLVGNLAKDYGGAVYSWTSGYLLAGGLMAGNRGAVRAGAVYLSAAQRLVNCTIANNSSASGGAVYNGVSGSSIANSILWGDSPQEIVNYSSAPTVQYSDIQGGSAGAGNVNTSPSFLSGASSTWTAAATYDAANMQITFTDATMSWVPGQWRGRFVRPNASQPMQLWISDNTRTTITVLADWSTIKANAASVPSGTSYAIYDYQLADNSPCIDAGSNLLAEPALLTDVFGQLRTNDAPQRADTGAGLAPIIDMGADEWFPSVPRDLDGDGDVDPADMDIFEACRTGPNVWYDMTHLPGGCMSSPEATSFLGSDFDQDLDVDQTDFGLLQRCLAGPDVAADASCGR